jgi:hypothetical protein
MPPFVRIHAPLQSIPLWTLNWEAAVVKVPLLFQRGARWMMAVYSEVVASFTCSFLLPWIGQDLVEGGGRDAHTSSSLIQAVLKLPP